MKAMEKLQQEGRRIVLSCAALVACLAATADDTPFRIPEAELQQKVTRIAVLPSRILVDTADRRAAAKRFDALVQQTLDGSGVDFIPASTFLELERETAKTMGGRYDVYTGELDEEKAIAINELAIREFERLHAFDAYLVPGVVRVLAPFASNDAAWDGVERYTTGGKVGLFSSPGDISGRMPAASFQAALIDKTEADTVYFVKRHGLELLLLLEKAKGLSTIGYDLPPLDQRLVDEAINREAVQRALAPLIELLASAAPGVPATPAAAETALTEGAAE